MGATLKSKVYKEKDDAKNRFPSHYKVTHRWEGNSTDIIKNSNKFYHAEIQVALNGRARIFTMYGRVGAVKPAKEYRYYPSEIKCMHDYETLISKKKNRKKNPYVEVDLAITSIGSDGAKDIKKPMTGVSVKAKKDESKLHKEVQRLIHTWFGNTADFIEMTLKCPLGQLTKEQIDKGYEILKEARIRVINKLQSSLNEYDILTSKFYSLIPHVLPHRINPSILRLDTIDKIMDKEKTLETFFDAKNVGSVLSKGASVDIQYDKLNSELEWVDHSDPIFKWIETLVHETRARNHRFLGKIKVFNIFKLSRNNESKYFEGSLERIAKEVKNPTKPKYTFLRRPDLSKDEQGLFKQANVWPLWHGTKPENMVGIISRGLMIRPSGAVYTGSMFGDALYHAENSSKSMNYTGCKGSYWAKSNGSGKSYLFLEDVIIGNPHVVYSSKFFRKPPKGYHSVYALPRTLYNSENMTYATSGENQQHRLRYIVEFQSKQ